MNCRYVIFFFFNKTYQSFLPFLFPVQEKRVIEEILLKRDYTIGVFNGFIITASNTLPLIDFDSSVGRNVSGE